MTTPRQEIEQRIATFAAAQVPPLSVAYEGVSFTRPVGVPWLEVFMMPASTVSSSLDASSNRERGTVMVNVWTPSGKGAGVAEQIAAKIVKLFPVIPKTGTVSTEQPVSCGQFKPTNDGWGCIPTSFPYRVESLA